MATALNSSLSLSSSSDEELPIETSKEQNNRIRLHAYLKLGREALLKKFHDNKTYSFSRDAKQLYLELQGRKSKIDQLKKQKVLFQDQYDLLIPPTGDEVDSQSFDVILLMVLLVNFCGYKYPQRAWIPQATDVGDFANIVRIKRLRDAISHLTNVSDAELKRIAKLFEQPLLALGIQQKKIDNISTLRIIDVESKTKLEKYEASQTNFSHNYNPPVDNFSSRDTELQSLHKKMINRNGSKLGVVLHGHPGVGKSEMARIYCSKFRGKWYEDSIIWVNAQSEATLESDFQEISDECNIQKTKNQDGTYVDRKKLVDLVFRHFAATITPNPRKVLFVFDGADDINALSKFLPKSSDYSPFILVTSQYSGWDHRFDKLPLDVFDKTTAFDFFINNTTVAHYNNNEDIHQLLQAISCQPLALQQAISYIKKNSITVQEYIYLLDQHRKEILSESTAEQNASVNNTLTISIDRLKLINPKVKICFYNTFLFSFSLFVKSINSLFLEWSLGF